jgi:N-acyl-D-aspartate/D-glutamate deacylase
VFELADEHVRVLEDLGWLERLATETGQPVLFSLSQTDFAPELWRDVLAGLEAAAGRGSPLFAQVAGRAIGILMNWRGTAHPFALHPSWQALSTLPWEEQLAQLRTPEVRARILGDTPLEVGVFEAYVTRTFDKMYAMGSSADYEPSPEDSLAARAAADGRNPAEVAYDLMLQDEGRGFLYFPLFNYSDKNLDLLHKLHNHPQTRMGLSDGGAHCGAICDGGMPTFMLTHWARDRARGPRISLERIIHRQTRQTAELYGLHDRGLLAPGYKADLNVIDYERLSLDLPRLVFDLPAGGRRLIQKAAGYEVTVCGGVVTFEHGEHTGAHPGSLIRGEQAAPKVASTATRRAG